MVRPLTVHSKQDVTTMCILCLQGLHGVDSHLLHGPRHFRVLQLVVDILCTRLFLWGAGLLEHFQSFLSDFKGR